MSVELEPARADPLAARERAEAPAPPAEERSAGWQVDVLWLPKRGSSEQEYEDAWAEDATAGRFAVADGATESSFSRQWAKLLVQQFVAEPPPRDAEALREWLRPAQRRWSEGIDWSRLPWYATEKARAGAFAALLGLELCPPARGGRGSWRAFAVGDCTAFQIRPEGAGWRLVAALPLHRSSAFSSRPLLLGTDPGRNRLALERAITRQGRYRRGDCFLLASDALAAWALSRHEAGEPVWEQLLAPADQAAFAALVAQAREAEAMRNDDVTLLRVAVR